MSNALIPPRLNSDGYPTRLYMVETTTATGVQALQRTFDWNSATTKWEAEFNSLTDTIEADGGDWVFKINGTTFLTGPVDSGSPVGDYQTGASVWDLRATAPLLGANTAEVTLSPGAPGATTAEVTLSPGAPGATTAEVTLSPGAPGSLIPEV